MTRTRSMTVGITVNLPFLMCRAKEPPCVVFSCTFSGGLPVLSSSC